MEVADAYLLWLKQQRDDYANSHFGCDWVEGFKDDSILGGVTCTYYEVMENIVRNPKCPEKVIQNFWERDRAYLQRIQQMARAKLSYNPHGSYFITLNFDKLRTTPESVYKLILWLRDKCKWIDEFQAVIENHRKEEGFHLHAHLIIKPAADEITYGSKIKDKLWSLKKIKSMMGGPQFIDYKNCEERHYKYIRGEKTDEKMPFVIKDREWRKRYCIPDFIEKKVHN